MDKWLLNDAIHIGTNRYENDMSHLRWVHFYTNGWRFGGLVWDINLRIGRRMFSVTFWRMPLARKKR